MKVLTLSLTVLLTLLISAGAGEVIVEITTAKGEPRVGTKVQVEMEDGEKSPVVKTGRTGVANVQWKGTAKRGKIRINGSTVYSGSMPLRISFSL